MSEPTRSISETITPRQEYLTKLHQLLGERFDEEGLRTLCFNLSVDYDDLPSAGRTNKARELVLYLNRRRRIHELVKAGKGLRPDVPWEDELPKHHRVPFKDRREVIRDILSSLAPPYHLLDAPAGYGKTDLLLELEREFQQQKWVVAYVSADEHPKLGELVRALSRELGLVGSLEGADARMLGLQLAGALKRERRRDIQKQGVVFLIDLGKAPSSVLIGRLLEEFIPNVQRSLWNLGFFRSKHNRFRVVLAGRYLTVRKEMPPKFLPLVVLQLPPFSYEILLNTSIDYLDGIDEEEIRQIAAHIMHLTGGHPGCMASLLEMYKEYEFPANDFLRIHRTAIQEIIEYEVEQVYEGIPGDLQDVMDVLGMFRYLHSDTLKYLVQDKCVPGHSNAFNLADKLTTSFLMGWQNHLLCNDSMHRLLALRLRQKEELGTLAQGICQRYLCASTAFRPELWAVECLYQYLQRFSFSIQTPEDRKKLGKNFSEHIVPDILRCLVCPLKKERRGIQWQKTYLEQALNEDKEFRFTINYYLREDQYDDKPYQDFVRRVDAFFAREIGEANA